MPARPTVAVGLTKQHIVDTALALMDEHGERWLTMRRLAERLDVSAPTLYWHIGSRAELLDAAVERAMAGVGDVEVVHGDWREGTRAFMAATRAKLTAHRSVTELMRNRYPESAHAMTRHALGLMASAGCSPPRAALYARLMIWRLLGFAMLENSITAGSAYHKPIGRRRRARRYVVSAPEASDRADIPTGPAEEALRILDLDELFEADCELFLSGVASAVHAVRSTPHGLGS